MDEYYSVIQFLPEPLRTELKAMPPERAACVQEIRLRAGQAVQLTVGGAWAAGRSSLPPGSTNRPCHRPAHAAQSLCRPLPGLRLCL